MISLRRLERQTGGLIGAARIWIFSSADRYEVTLDCRE